MYEQVNVLDDTPPAIKDKVLENNILSFRLEDTQSGVDYSSISASDEDKTDILPLSIDRSTGLVTFEIEKENIAITAKDKIGNELHVTFTPQGESFEEAEMESEEMQETAESEETEETKESKNTKQTKESVKNTDTTKTTTKATTKANTTKKK